MDRNTLAVIRKAVSGVSDRVLDVVVFPGRGRRARFTSFTRQEGPGMLQRCSASVAVPPTHPCICVAAFIPWGINERVPAGCVWAHLRGGEHLEA
jgi:hypothetical protein